jgi:hypothetical protein
MKEAFSTKVQGQVLIKDDLGNVLVNQKNAIHPGNMATAIARGLSNAAKGQVWKMKLGNQGTYVDSSQQIVFRPPNTLGVTANLYNPTYFEIVDDADAGVGVGNSVTFTNIPLSTSTRVIITCIIAANEAVNRPTDQADLITASNGGLDAVSSTPTEGNFFFDELGLFTEGTGVLALNETDELMLSHLIFSPIEHTGNRELSIIYTISITVT